MFMYRCLWCPNTRMARITSRWDAYGLEAKIKKNCELNIYIYIDDDDDNNNNNIIITAGSREVPGS